jgi:amino-acid N-acetyltransferase
MIRGSSGFPPFEPELRSAQPGDLTAVKKLLEVCDLPSRGVTSPPGNFFVAEFAGAVLGVAGLELHRRSGLLRSLAVHPAWRNRGLAQALCKKTLARAEAPREIQASEEFREICPDSAVLMHRTLE